MTAVRFGALILIVALASAAVRAEDNAPSCAHPAIPPKLKRPQDFAPPRLTVVPRPPEEYRPKNSLLATGVGGRRQVDTAELHRRQLAMYSGERQTDSLPGLTGNMPMPVVAPVRALSPSETNYGAIAFWTFVVLSLLLSVALIARVLFIFHRR